MVTMQEMVYSNMLTINAVVKLLDERGVLSKLGYPGADHQALGSGVAPLLQLYRGFHDEHISN